VEFLTWRDFRNRRELAALAGLVGTPYNSGESELKGALGRIRDVRVGPDGDIYLLSDEGRDVLARPSRTAEGSGK
jgi:glucose/arabinose dehydrogenase